MRHVIFALMRLLSRLAGLGPHTRWTSQVSQVTLFSRLVLGLLYI